MAIERGLVVIYRTALKEEVPLHIPFVDEKILPKSGPVTYTPDEVEYYGLEKGIHSHCGKLIRLDEWIEKHYASRNPS